MLVLLLQNDSVISQHGDIVSIFNGNIVVWPRFTEMVKGALQLKNMSGARAGRFAFLRHRSPNPVFLRSR